MPFDVAARVEVDPKLGRRLGMIQARCLFAPSAWVMLITRNNVLTQNVNNVT